MAACSRLSSCNLPPAALNHRPFLIVSCLLALCSFNPPWVSGWTCLNSCGGVPVQYPFGTGQDCGAKAFQSYVNCTNGRLQFYTPTGTYLVQSIDYNNNIMVIRDPLMSTCSSAQNSASFGLALGSPFSIVSDTIVLLGCSSTSLYSPLRNLCDPSGSQICASLYRCPAVSQLGLPFTGPASTCCVYSSSQLTNPPYQINLPLLQCSSYTSIYSFGPQYSYGNGASSNYQNPNTWSYGIALRFYFDEYGDYGHCKICQQTNGVCAFNVGGFICVCPNGVNTTTQCRGYVNHGPVSYTPYQALWTIGMISLLVSRYIMA